RLLTTAAAVLVVLAVADTALARPPARPPVHVATRPKVAPTVHRPMPPRVVRPVAPKVVRPVPVRHPGVYRPGFGYPYVRPVVVSPVVVTAPPVYVPGEPVIIPGPPQVVPVSTDDPP